VAWGCGNLDLLVVFAYRARRIVSVVAVLEGMLYCSCILYYNHAHRHHQTKSLTPFFCLSNIIATTPIMKNNIAPLLLLSQDYMFFGATAFNQDISDWNVGSGIYFVSGMGLWKLGHLVVFAS